MNWAFRRIASRGLPDEVRQVQVRKVRQLYAMLEGLSCRAAAVRHYFGEADAEPCGVCDICVSPVEGVDASEAAQKALSAVHRLAGRVGRGRIVDHLLGKTKDASEFEAGLSTFGVGREFSPTGWRELIDRLLYEGLLIEDPNDGRPLVGLGDAAAVRAVYRGERKVTMRRALEALDLTTRSGRPRKRRGGVPLEMTERDLPLFEALRAWRRSAAAAQSVPPYVIFADRTLAEIARERPGSRAALAEVNGVGEAKLAHYGAEVLNIVREHA
jgi:ATP-dependent DNA helicase RecQ